MRVKLRCIMNKIFLFPLRRFSTRPSATYLSAAEVKTRVLDILQSFPSSPKVIGDNAHFVADLGFDSLLRRDVTSKLESEFCVSLSKGANIVDVQSAIQYFSTHPKAR
eukprot:gene5297-10591_t